MVSFNQVTNNNSIRHLILRNECIAVKEAIVMGFILPYMCIFKKDIYVLPLKY